MGRDLLQEPPSGLDVGQVLLAGILLLAFVDQAVSAPDALDGLVAGCQRELAFQPGGSERGQLASQLNDLALDAPGRFMRAMRRSATVAQQSRRPLLSVPPQPLADPRKGCLEYPRRGFYAVLAGVSH